MVLFTYVSPDFHRLQNSTSKSTRSADLFPPLWTHNSWSQTTLVTISHINGLQSYCRIWYQVFLHIAVSYYFSEFYTLATRTWISNRHQIPPIFQNRGKLLCDALVLLDKENGQRFHVQLPTKYSPSFLSLLVQFGYCQSITNIKLGWKALLPLLVSGATFSFLELHSRSELNTEYRLYILA